MILFSANSWQFTCLNCSSLSRGRRITAFSESYPLWNIPRYPFLRLGGHRFYASEVWTQWPRPQTSAHASQTVPNNTSQTVFLFPGSLPLPGVPGCPLYKPASPQCSPQLSRSSSLFSSPSRRTAAKVPYLTSQRSVDKPASLPECSCCCCNEDLMKLQVSPSFAWSVERDRK